jgi:Cu(I)/Ag(I) efflux system membrane protein CusA/SilA
MNKTVRLPGLGNIWGYPIKIRIDMLTTGTRTPVAVKITGPDPAALEKLAETVVQAAQAVPGTRGAVTDQMQNGHYIEIIPNRTLMARYGIDLATVQTVIATALGGTPLSEAVEGRERYPVIVRYARPYREDLSDIGNVIVTTRSGATVPLSDIATIRVTDGPAMIRSENAQLERQVLINVQGRDLGGYIAALQKKLNMLQWPAGYGFKLAGQFEHSQDARKRLSFAIPATLLFILTLLYLHFGRWDRTALIMLSVPFGVIGGFWCLWLAGYNMSVAVAVGFIALAGIAVETAIVMLIYIDHEMRDHPPADYAALIENIKRGAVQRVRPKLMTVSVIILGLIPIFMNEGPGSDVMRRIALPMIGGMISTTVLTLILIPVLYALYARRHIEDASFKV